MNGKYCAQIRVNQKHFVNNFVIRKQTLPKRQFAEVIALPDDIINVTKTEPISYTNGTNRQWKWCWCSPSTNTGYSDHHTNGCQKPISIVSTQPKSSNIKSLKTNQMSDKRDSDKCVDCVCDTAINSMVCLFLKPYTWCLSP